jgi:hypothetical protein
MDRQEMDGRPSRLAQLPDRPFPAIFQEKVALGGRLFELAPMTVKLQMKRHWLLISLLAIACTFPEGDGGKCSVVEDCKSGLKCIEGQCAIGSQLLKTMAKQSGVGEAKGPSSSGSVTAAVRIRTAAGRSLAIAMCDSDERLIGGWCSPSMRNDGWFSVGSAVAYSETDTIGAHWKCASKFDMDVESSAMCQKLSAVPEPSPRRGQAPTP